MSDNETIREDELEQENIDEVEETEVEETEEETTDNVEEEGDTDDGIDWKKEALKFKGILKRKAEQAELLKKKVPQTKKQITSNLSVEETVLKAQGMSDDELAMLKKVASVQEVSLLEAKNDDLYTSWKEKNDAELRAEQARMSASRKSGQRGVKKDFNTKGLSKEEHKELWKQKMGIN